MRRYINPEIVLGFLLGVLFLAFVVGVTSYQTDHCAYKDSEGSERPNQHKQIAVLQSEDAEREQDVTDYAKSHPWVCGVMGFPSMAIDYMDHNEGFFVGTFTIGLFFATIFLWRSTDKLWSSGERQISHAADAADAASESNRITRELFVAEQRPWLAFTICLANENPVFLENGGIGILLTATVKNIGKLPAFDAREGSARAHIGYDLNEEYEDGVRDFVRNRLDYKGWTIFPGEEKIWSPSVILTKSDVIKSRSLTSAPMHFITFCYMYNSSVTEEPLETTRTYLFSVGKEHSPLPLEERSSISFDARVQFRLWRERVT